MLVPTVAAIIIRPQIVRGVEWTAKKYITISSEIWAITSVSVYRLGTILSNFVIFSSVKRKDKCVSISFILIVYIE